MTELRWIAPPPWYETPIEGHFGASGLGMHHRLADVGDAWYATPSGNGTQKGGLGRWTIYPDGHYRGDLTIAAEHRAARVKPILVMLPGEMNPYCLHAPISYGPAGWFISGDLENLDHLTVTPSINISSIGADGARVQRWHGSITGGRLV